MVGSGEVETIENDELVQVDHPDSGLRDVLLQNCLRQTSFHLYRKTDETVFNFSESPQPNISGCPLGGLLGQATLSCKHLVAVAAAPSWMPSPPSAPLCKVWWSGHWSALSQAQEEGGHSFEKAKEIMIVARMRSWQRHMVAVQYRKCLSASHFRTVLTSTND